MKAFKLWLLAMSLCVITLLAACGRAPKPEEELDTQIVGGGYTAAGEYPWMVQLKYRPSTESDDHFCGGTLIDRSWVLTAAHCVFGGSMSDFSVVLGQHQRSVSEGTEQTIALASMVIHPSYNHSTKDNDIALLQLASPATLNARVALVSLANVPAAGTSLRVIGWGDTTEGGTSSDLLLKVDVPRVSAANCSAAYPGGITSSMFCAGYPSGSTEMKDSCQGDSGGPIFLPSTRKQVGLVSWGIGCARPGLYGVYTDLSRFYDWIYSTVPSQRALGWVWASQEGAALNTPYTPNTNYQYNTHFNALPLVNNTVTRLDVGKYKVTFTHLNVTGGTAHTTAYGGNHHCKVLSWARVGTNVDVYVNCFTPTGAPANGKFTAFFYQDDTAKSNIGGNAYLRANRPSGTIDTCYTPLLDFQFNSRDAVNKVCFKGTGHYEVRLPEMSRNALEADKGGTIIVTAMRTGPQRCKVGNWWETGTEVRANVYCYRGNTLTNSAFTFSFMRQPGNLASNVSEEKLESWYVWADGATVPSLFYQSNTYGDPSSSGSATKATMTTLTGSGHYLITLPGVTAFNKTTTQLTAYGSNSVYCNVVGWSASATAGATDVEVQCYDASGNPANAQFDLLYYTNRLILF